MQSNEFLYSMFLNHRMKSTSYAKFKYNAHFILFDDLMIFSDFLFEFLVKFTFPKFSFKVVEYYTREKE